MSWHPKYYCFIYWVPQGCSALCWACWTPWLGQLWFPKWPVKLFWLLSFKTKTPCICLQNNILYVIYFSLLYFSLISGPTYLFSWERELLGVLLRRRWVLALNKWFSFNILLLPGFPSWMFFSNLQLSLKVSELWDF